ncbi:hypothetical protein GCM10010156_29020 [Planobispora rosea]|uniref:PepSY domain-containing protein n=1 Tax=Planobispora rosea TaxID=35762 RepID=A0A8J3RXT4_PLARO|nr:PepSY domain-containing protein [Planobispora rosea]GGS68361.1 hypothetical protein GCM10010156_29020 [Planobispora rosea]GIH81987.1 hypothetical protein Pro02_03950 [Planobispora rosea]
MRKPVIILSGLALAALAAGGGIAFADQYEADSPSPAATAAPGTGTPAPDADDEAENGADDSAEDRVPSKPAVMVEQAQKTALSQVSGGWIVSSELEDESGTPVWEIGVADGAGAEREVLVDAATGKVLPATAGAADGQENEAQDDD